MSASLYQLVLLVIGRTTLIREYTVLIGDPIAVQILTHNPSLSLFRDTPLLPSPHAPKLAIIDLTYHVHLPQEISRASAACSIATNPHIRYRAYLVLLFNTTGEENKYKTTTLFPLLFVQSHYTWLFGLLVTVSFKGVF